ncbi:rho guanine nucleotide exchange factor 2-like isoform X1 [Carassius carassius]|uniref:rho guanine nucleotide exchange factor 2-like isoform X1 n=1 Tax=Carassius carassius TaxID=217509 RepID=UPI0028691366|nr:rho guanine nucleotide exchange factor 2-like isoform X1 [Carassius carassius]XP_059363369.1 rho guanine nucleotide exchange factor 2-like isoform X1 [Carassius carassius]XP_059363370.1 rho guanine nucleotide exchange factor 2-like isoform X1 [Carassius carassius]
MSRVSDPSPKARQEKMKDVNVKNKEKERKAREKETKERESRYSNGHLFTSLSVSATTLCSACNKSITAKEALSCPTCNVTIHNRCRDTLANCAKMKQKQQKLALLRSTATLHNVALRSKNPILKERPSSAIYPSETLRQSFLGSRKGRSTLSLNKSVSTNNIAGSLNDDSPVGLRRILSHSTDSLNFRNRAMSMESLNDEGEMYYASMMEELEKDGKDFEVDSWSMAVDSSYLQSQRKDVIKRQDVIYELIQTELNHVRTLRIMEGVFRRGMLEEVLMEMGVVHAIFPCLDQLLSIHSSFLSQLLQRRNDSLAPSSARNFTIQKLGDILVEQFSGQNAEEMRKCYVEFCSRHLKAVKLYKELLARDKRFQQFIRRVSRGSLLRRHGVQECILLVTQRITKYPVLIKRILDNTKGNEEESKSLADSLTLIRELLCSVDQQVQELERAQRLQEIQSRLDPRAETKVKGGGVFGGGELLRRRLIHEGALLWKTAQGSRLKDVHVLLMTDILVFMQEKDQKFIFPCLDKPAVLCLQNLIVRDIANQQRGMFLISHSTPPEMYELHAASKEDRNTWMKLIQRTVSNCPSREDFPLIETEDKALLRRLRADIQQKDREVLELLQERVTLFSDLAEATGGQNVNVPTNSRNIFRADTPYAPQAEKLLNDAIVEVDRLSEVLLGSSIERPQSCRLNGESTGIDKGTISVNGIREINSSSNKISQDRNGNQLQDKMLNEEVCQRLVNLSTQLHAVQAAVIKQDSFLEVYMQKDLCPATASELEAGGPQGTRGDLAELQHKYNLLQGEVIRLRAAQDKKGEKQLQELRLKDTMDTRDTLISQETAVQVDGMQEDSPRDLQDIPEESECGTEAHS